MPADDLHLRHARAYLALLQEWGESPLEAALRELDASWRDVQKAQSWCTARAGDLEEAARLCGRFASAAPHLVRLRLSSEEWLAWLGDGLEGADDKARLSILESLGYVHLQTKDAARARLCFEEQLKLAEWQGDRAATGRALCGLANAASLAGGHAQAGHLFERSLDIAREIHSKPLEADVLGSLAISLDDRGRPEEAKDAAHRALEIARRLGDRAGESRHLGNLAGLFKHTGELGKAFDHYREQLAIVRSLADRHTEAKTLHNLGLIHLEHGDLDEAATAFHEALALRRRIGDRPGEGRELAALGMVLRRQGDNRGAIPHFWHWLQDARERGDRLEEAEALTNLGNAAEDVATSREHYEAALAIVRELGHSRGLAILLNNMGRLYDLAGEPERALELIEEAVEVHRQAGNRLGEARSLWHLAKIAFRIGSVPAALGWAYQALDLYHAMRQRDWVLDLIYLIGNWIVETGDDELRQDYELRAERILSDLDDAKVEWIRTHSGLKADRAATV